MRQVWACNQCRSINDTRASRCYKCLTPRDQAEADPAAIPPTASADDRPALSLPPYRPATVRAVIAGSLIGVAAGLQLLGTINETILARQLIDDTTDISDAQIQYLAIMAAIALAVGVSAFVMFGLWLSKAVATIPALGLGYTRVTARQALFEVLFPLGLLLVSAALVLVAFFLFPIDPAAASLAGLISAFVAMAGYLAIARRVPPVIWDLMRRLDPTSGRVGALIAGAWFGLVLGFLVPRIGGILVGIDAGLTGASRALIIVHAVYLDQIAAALYLVAGGCLIGIIVWVETRTRAVAQRRMVAPDPGAVTA